MREFFFWFEEGGRSGRVFFSSPLTTTKKTKKKLSPTGNGIQDITLQRDDILYVSLHRGNGFYPGTGRPDEVGDPENLKSMGKNANVAWPRGGLGDAEYDAAFDLVLLPLARAFDPDLVIVAAGFDAAAGDPLGGMAVTPRGYRHMTRRLLTLAKGKAVLALEGGYNVGATASAAAACVEVLLSEDGGDGRSGKASSGASDPAATAKRSGSSEAESAATTAAAGADSAASAAAPAKPSSSSASEDDSTHVRESDSGSDEDDSDDDDDGFVLGRAVARPSRDAAPALAATAAALAPHWKHRSEELARLGTPAGFSAAWRDYCLKAKPARLTRGSSRRKSL